MLTYNDIKNDLDFSTTGPLSIDELCFMDWKDHISGNQNNVYVDFDVYLPTYGHNLQRPYVWTQENAENYIISILQDKPTLPIYVNQKHEENIVEIIDGKQRLMSLLKFLHNEIPIRGTYFDDCADDIKWRIKGYNPQAIVHHERSHTPSSILSDNDKIRWFLNINTSAFPQEAAHLDVLRYELNDKH